MDRRQFLETLSLPAISLLPLRQIEPGMGTDRKVVIGIDTTGSDPTEAHRLVDLAAIEIIGQRISGVNFRSPPYPGPDPAPALLRGHQLKAFVGDATLIFYDAPHHLEFIKREFSIAGQAFFPTHTVIDACVLASGKDFSHAFIEAMFAPLELEPDDNSLAIREAIWVARLYLGMMT